MKKIFYALAACLPFAFLTSCTPAQEDGTPASAECTCHLEADVDDVITLADKRSKDVKLNVLAQENVGTEASLTLYRYH